MILSDFAGANLFNTIDSYTQLWFVPQNNPTWDFTDESKLPKAVSKTLPANQWYQTWMPPEFAPGMRILFK